MSNNIAFPSFYRSDRVGEIYLPDYAAIMNEALAFKSRYGLNPSGGDRERIALFGIDVQIGFSIPGASLFVPGAVEDSRRICEFIYRNLGVLSEIHFSLDTHRAFQIFYPTFWIGENGRHPDPFTIITTKEIREGIWKPALFPLESEAYVAELERTGKYVLVIWPFHTMLGAVDHALVPAVFEAALFHSIARQKQTGFETKGTHPLTENYSVLEPEVKQIKAGGRVIAAGQFNASFFKALMKNDRVYLCGQAKSHCVKATIESLLGQILADDPDLVKKVYILEDCMSSVPAVRDGEGNLLSPDFPAIADESIGKFRAAGMSVVSSSDPV